MLVSLPYKQLISTIAPLDLLLFRGTDYVSQLVKIAEEIVDQSAYFSHCGVVVTSDLLPFIRHLVPGRLYVLESTYSHGNEPRNVVTNKHKFGVQIRDLEQVIKSYSATANAQVAIARLNNNPWRAKITDTIHTVNKRRKKVKALTKEFYQNYGQDIYEVDPTAFLSIICPCFRPLRFVINETEIGEQKIFHSKKLTGVFCSELVAILYKDLSILPKQVNPQNITPVDFIDSNLGNIVEIPIIIIP